MSVVLELHIVKWLYDFALTSSRCDFVHIVFRKMVIPRTNPSNKRLTVHVAGTSVARQNLMGQRSGIDCDVVTVAVTGETGKSLMGQRSGIGCDTRRSLMGSENNK